MIQLGHSNLLLYKDSHKSLKFLFVKKENV